jgi:uncharacterized membrane protein YdbT with pleckstrin-like domain
MTRLAQTRPPINLQRAHEDAAEGIERTIFVARPTLLFVKIGYVMAALAAILTTILLAYLGIRAFASVLVALPLLLIPAFYHFKRNSVRYTLTASKIEIDQGLIGKRTRNIPLSKIQDVTVSASIPQRLLGYGSLTIDNATEVGGTVVMRNIRDPRSHAEMIMRELRRLVR